MLLVLLFLEVRELVVLVFLQTALCLHGHQVVHKVIEVFLILLQFLLKIHGNMFV